MIELKIPAVILRERRKKNLTQEELAAALIGSGKIDEGFALLEEAFPRYERWLAIPPGKAMAVGESEAFGGACVTKWDESCVVNMVFPDGKMVWIPYLWLFWQLKGDIYLAMTRWPWFEAVKDDPRYPVLLERAKALAEVE